MVSLYTTLAQLYSSLFVSFVAPYAVAYSFVSNLIMVQSKKDVEQLADLIENELILKKEKKTFYQISELNWFMHTISSC